MPNSRKRPPSSATPVNHPQTTPTERREAVKTNPKARAKKRGALAALSTSIATTIGSPSQGPSDTGVDQPETSKESRWRTAYAAARMAVEIAKESVDMLPPLKAVVGAISVLIKNYDVKYTQASVSLIANRFFAANRRQREADRGHRGESAVSC